MPVVIHINDNGSAPSVARCLRIIRCRNRYDVIAFRNSYSLASGNRLLRQLKVSSAEDLCNHLIIDCNFPTAVFLIVRSVGYVDFKVATASFLSRCHGNARPISTLRNHLATDGGRFIFASNGNDPGLQSTALFLLADIANDRMFGIAVVNIDMSVLRIRVPVTLQVLDALSGVVPSVHELREVLASQELALIQFLHCRRFSHRQVPSS